MKRYKEFFQQEQYRNNILITWDFSSKCNYACSYCPPKFHDGKFGFPTFENVIKFIDELKTLYPGKVIAMDLLGGEPTLWPKLIDFLEFYKNDDLVRVQLISNGSRTLRWWNKNIDMIDQVCLSYHHEYADKEHFFEVCKILTSKSKLSVVNFLMSPGHFDHLKEYANKLVEELDDIILNFKPLRQVENESIYYEYTEDESNFLKTTTRLKSKKISTLRKSTGSNIMNAVTLNGEIEYCDLNVLIAEQRNSFLGWECNIGIEGFNILMNGDISRGNCAVGGILGNIHGEYNLNVEPVICNKKLCTCKVDLYITKKKVNK